MNIDEIGMFFKLQKSLIFCLGKILSTIFFSVLNSVFLKCYSKNIVALVEKVEKCIASCDDVCLGEKMGFSSF